MDTPTPSWLSTGNKRAWYARGSDAANASATAAAIDLMAVPPARQQQLERERQLTLKRNVGFCAHLNRHGCGLGAVKNSHGLCSPCAFFCMVSDRDRRTANTDTRDMDYEERVKLELALARQIMFCDADIEPTVPGVTEATMASSQEVPAVEDGQGAAGSAGLPVRRTQGCAQPLKQRL